MILISTISPPSIYPGRHLISPSPPPGSRFTKPKPKEWRVQGLTDPRGMTSMAIRWPNSVAQGGSFGSFVGGVYLSTDQVTGRLATGPGWLKDQHARAPVKQKIFSPSLGCSKAGSGIKPIVFHDWLSPGSIVIQSTVRFGCSNRPRLFMYTGIGSLLSFPHES